MWKPANFIEAMLPIFLVNAIFCHGVFQYPYLDKSKLYYSLIFSITTAIVFFIFFIYVFLKWIDRFLSTTAKSIYYLNTSVMILAMFINVIVGWIYKNVSKYFILNKLIDNFLLFLNRKVCRLICE